MEYSKVDGVLEKKDLYNNNSITITDENVKGKITERDRLRAGLLILLGLALLFLSSEIIYAFAPVRGESLLEICKTVLPPLATLIIAFYFKDKTN